MQRYLLFVDDLSTWVGKLSPGASSILTAVTCYDVVARYVFSAPTGWAYDTEYILYGTLFMMAGAYGVSQNAHVRGDFVSRMLSVKVNASHRTGAPVPFLLPRRCWRSCIPAGDFFHISWMQNEHSASSPTGPPIYPFKAVIPLAAIFLLLQGTVEVIRCVVTLRTGEVPKRRRDVEELEKLILEEARAGMTADQILNDVEHHGESK